MSAARGDVWVAWACLLVLAVVSHADGQNGELGIVEKTLGEKPVDANANFTELTGSHGYKSEEHTVITEDGYIISLFRIPKGKSCRGAVRQPPALLMHGLLLSADSWLDAGPSAGLAYLLADACYDLWAGNVRGTYYGRRNLRLDPDSDAEFWRFSTHEMGTRDLPAMIDYVLKYTSSADLLYVGFSQGGRIFFTMCSELPDYCDKVRVAVHLAPAVRGKYTRSIPTKLLVKTYAVVAPLLTSPFTMEALPKGGPVQLLLSTLCRNAVTAGSVCKALLSIIDSYDPGSVSTDTARTLYDHFPGGTSADTLAFFGQTAVSEAFYKFDYGPTKNLELYGQATPPPYNLSRASLPVVLIYGKNDFLIDPKDVLWLSTQLPNVLETYEVTRPAWNHLDNCYSQYTKLTVFPKINHYLQKYSFVKKS